jgi:glycine/D-amino acid oxidase-like deaminating enzyme/nitrite reductase/ring-hydroxylating ferredoxin subunit
MHSDSGHTQSVWMDTAEVPDYPALIADTRADVCVVGAGIAGLTTAYLLAREGKSVVVLDDGPIAGGETGRTTAHLSNVFDDRYYEVVRLHGEDVARRTLESHTAAIETIERIVRTEGIDCDYRRLDGWLFLSETDARKRPDILDKEEATAHRLGMAVNRAARAPIPRFDTGPALRFPNQAQFHPVKYLAGVARAFTKLGGRIHTATHVESIAGGKHPSVKSSDGCSVDCDAVCVCTNSPISDYVVTHVKQAPYRTFVIGARIAGGAVPVGLYWDTPSPYHYVRLMSGTDSGEDILIVGGEDHKTGQKDDAEARFKCLEEWARARFPIGAVIYRWSGQVMEPADYLAFIGPNPDGAENVYLATGDSGNGMTHGTIAGLLLTDLVFGRPNPWAEIYDPKRVSAKSAPDLLKENFNVAVQYADWVKPGEASSADDIPPGEGAVLRRGMHRVAAYRDDDGNLHERSAVCTHLACIVRWNSTEKSWDCPCHGSRFDAFGSVVNGPALKALGPAEPEHHHATKAEHSAPPPA